MLLRDVEPSDLPIFYESQILPEAHQMAGVAPRDLLAFYTHWDEKIFGDPRIKVKTIVDEGRVAGHILSFELEDKRMVGYWLGKEFWGRGIASQALTAYLATYEHTRPLYATAGTHNLASLRILEKHGFRPTGQAKPGYDGRPGIEMCLTTKTFDPAHHKN